MFASCLQLAGLVVLAAGGLGNFGGRRSLRFTAVSACVGAGFVVLGVALQALMTTIPFAARLDEPLLGLTMEYLSDTRSGRFASGTGVLVGVVAACALVALYLGERAQNVLRVILLVAVGLLALASAVSGHAGSAPGDHGHVMVAAHAAHMACAVLWVALAASLLLQWTAPATLRAALQRAGRQALPLALTVGITGPVLAWLHGVGFGDLWASTYGQLVVVKSALFTVVLALAAVNRFHALRPGVMADRPHMAAGLLAVEGVALVAILILAGTLAVTPPVH